MEDEFNAANPLDLQVALEHVEVPASTAALVDTATVAGAGPTVLETLGRLPDREWRSIDEVVAAATTGFRPNDDEPRGAPEIAGTRGPDGGSSSATAASTPTTPSASTEPGSERAGTDASPTGDHDNPLLEAMDRLESEQRLDGAVDALDRLAQPLRTGGARAALGGQWLGHALHPLLTDLPLGCWLSSAILDLTPGATTRKASKRLVGAGVALAIPTALAGVSDWGVTSDQRARRVGFVHAALNTVVLGLYAWSWNLRRRNHHWRGILAGLAGGGTAIVSGYLGGHLSFRLGVMTQPSHHAA